MQSSDTVARNVHILVIEREPAISSLLHGSFGDRNCTVSVFSSVERLLAEERTPAHCAVVVVDLDTSDDSSGISLISKLKGAPRTHALPVVAVSTHRDNPHIIGVLDAGADDCIAKPVAPREFTARITAILRRRH